MMTLEKRGHFFLRASVSGVVAHSGSTHQMRASDTVRRPQGAKQAATIHRNFYAKKTTQTEAFASK
jgi:hypothetical protein